MLTFPLFFFLHFSLFIFQSENKNCSKALCFCTIILDRTYWNGRTVFFFHNLSNSVLFGGKWWTGPCKNWKAGTTSTWKIWTCHNCSITFKSNQIVIFVQLCTSGLLDFKQPVSPWFVRDDCKWYLALNIEAANISNFWMNGPQRTAVFCKEFLSYSWFRYNKNLSDQCLTWSTGPLAWSCAGRPWDVGQDESGQTNKWRISSS